MQMVLLSQEDEVLLVLLQPGDTCNIVPDDDELTIGIMF